MLTHARTHARTQLFLRSSSNRHTSVQSKDDNRCADLQTLFHPLAWSTAKGFLDKKKKELTISGHLLELLEIKARWQLELDPKP